MAFGTLSTTASTDVEETTFWKGSEYQGGEALSATVTVVANGTFKINTGTISIELTST